MATRLFSHEVYPLKAFASDDEKINPQLTALEGMNRGTTHWSLDS